jgi:hypothetical protein
MNIDEQLGDLTHEALKNWDSSKPYQSGSSRAADQEPLNIFNTIKRSGITVPTFNGAAGNYAIWKLRIQVLLESLNLV